ncbi:MAG TPA: AAA family ATPase [Gammaproteobacteria bacterium]|nr:AAA family ATPase [Gammaproteobacteria bacterium]
MTAARGSDALASLVDALAAQFAARGDNIERFETHISTVLLAGDYAYKFKKPVDFGFLDYTTLDRRRHYCELELALNARHAPGLYLDVLPVTAGPTLGGTGPVIEWTLRMRRFATDQRLDVALEDGRVDAADVAAIARALAETHAHAAGAPAAGRHGTPPLVRSQLLAGLEVLASFVPDLPAFLRELEAAFAAKVAAFEDRLQAGHVRDCHGDLHLSNLVRYEGRWQAFDCIEFDDELRYIDTASDLAFPLMDFDVRGHETLANALLNDYLASGGDYGLFAVLDYYLLYRSVVRAKVACLSSDGSGDAADRAARTRAARHLALARRYLAPRGAPALYLTHGVSGSGKSWLARRLASARGFVHLRSDVERKRRAGLAATAASHSALDADLYDRAHTDATYERLLQLAEQLLGHACSVIVDASFLAAARRAPFAALARRLGVDFVILDCAAPRATLEARIAARQAAGTDASEATLAVLARQIDAREPLSAQERRHVIAADDIDDARLETLPGAGRLARSAAR